MLLKILQNARCNDEVVYRKDDQYTTFRIKKEKGKKKRDILSIYNAVSLPWQNVLYCGMVGTVLVRLRPLGANSCKREEQRDLTFYFYDIDMLQ